MKIGLIGGSGLLESDLFASLPVSTLTTASGPVSVRRGIVAGVDVIFIQRHGADPSGKYAPPHAINFQAITRALLDENVDFAFGVCSVGSLKATLQPGCIIVPSDFWCPYDLRSLHDDARAHVMPELNGAVRRHLLDALFGAGLRPVDGGVYANTRGPRFETKAEIQMLCTLGHDVVGMTAAHEAALLCEAGVPYACVAMVDNMANGLATALSLPLFHAAQKTNRGTVERMVSAILEAAAANAAPLAAAMAAAKAPDAATAASATGPGAAVTLKRRVVDSVLHARFVVPVVPEDTVLEFHAVVVDAGKIVAVLPSDEARMQFSARSEEDLGNHVLLPGLIDAHTHMAMNNMRGVADDLSLIDWLTGAIWPLEGKFMSHAYVRDGVKAAIAELVRGGVTCANDMYFFPDAACEAVVETGFRATVGAPVLEFPNPYTPDPNAVFEKFEATMAKWAGKHPLLRFSVAPHAPYTVSDASFTRVRETAEKYDLRIHLHLHETKGECVDSEAGTQSMHKHLSDEKTRPFANLDRLGVISERLIAVHMTQLTDAEIARCASSGLSVVHCPVSNMKLASGFSPVQKLMDAGVNVALGTDSVTSNNTLDMFQEMRLAALLGKVSTADPTAVPAKAALRMATINGARALGIEDRVGSIEVGKDADLTAVRVDALEATPLFDVVSHLVFAIGRDSVTDVWVAGRRLLRARELTTIDLPAVLQTTRDWGAKMAKDQHDRQMAALAAAKTGTPASEPGASPFETLTTPASGDDNQA